MLLVLFSLWKLQVLGVLCQKPEAETNTDILAWHQPLGAGDGRAHRGWHTAAITCEPAPPARAAR